MFLLLLPLFLWANVDVHVDKNALYRGDSVTYTISATGSDIEFPNIDTIGGYAIEARGRSSNIKIVNGNFEKTVSKSFRFSPRESVEIPSYKVLVSGGVEKTKPLKVEIVEPTQDKSAPVVLDIKLSKEKVHVGEMVEFDLVFKKKPNVPVYKLDIEEPKFEDFWVKKLDGVIEGVEGEYTTQTHRYLLFAQKSGELSIPSITANIGQLSRQNRRGIDPFFNSAFGQQLRYTKVFSNALSVEVEALPNGLELYGDFNIKAKVDKRSVLANKPLNLTLVVKGVGNIDDVQKFTLDIPGAIIYANEPVINSHVQDGKYGGTFEQKIVIIADSSYTIPPISLHYFDSTTQQERVITTEAIAIDVTGGVATVSHVETLDDGKVAVAETSTQKAKTVIVTKNDTKALLLAGLVGFGIGALFVWLFMQIRRERTSKEQVELPLEKRIAKCKSDKALFELLLPHKQESSAIAEVLVQLEENLYRGASHKVDTKKLISHMKGDVDSVELP